MKRWLRVAARSRLLVSRSRHAEARYRSPREIALANAADSLGVELGNDYLDGIDPEALSADIAEQAAPDRVNAFREELIVYIDARNRRRRRLRVLRIGAALLSLALATVLASELARSPSSDKPRRGPVAGSVLDNPLLSSRRDLPPTVRRGVGVPKMGSQVVTEMPADGRDTYIHTAYKDLNDDICANTAQVFRGVTRSEWGGGCMAPRQMERAMARVPAFVTGSGGGAGYVLLNGYGRADLERIVPLDPRVRIKSAITNVWHPGENASDDFVIRAFLLRISKGAGVRLGAMIAANRRNMGLEAVFTDGSRAAVTDYLEALQGERPPTETIDRIPEPIRYDDCVVLLPGEKLPRGRRRC